MKNKTRTIKLFIVLVNMALCSCASSGVKLHTETDSLSYATGYCSIYEYKKPESNIFWFTKGAVPDIEECNFDTIAATLRAAFAGHQPMALRDANLKLHDFFDALDAGHSINLDSLAIIYGINFYEDKFRNKVVQFEQNADILIKGMKDALTGNPKPLIESEQAYDLLIDFYEVRLPARNMVKTQQYFAELEAATPGIQRSKSGVLYRIDDVGSNERITSDTDICKMNCRQSVQLGGVIMGENSSEYEIWQSFSYINFPSSDFLEIMKGIGVGGKITIWVNTSSLYKGISVSPNMPVVCEYEMVSIQPYQKK